MTFVAQKIDHVEVLVADLESAARWYHRVFGLEEVARWDPEPVMIGVGGTKLALFRSTEPGPNANPGHRGRARWHRVAFRTDAAGFEAAQKHLRDLAIPFRGPVDHGIAQSVYFLDPDGNPLEITHYETSASS